jgi:hypothetical protein
MRRIARVGGRSRKAGGKDTAVFAVASFEEDQQKNGEYECYRMGTKSYHLTYMVAVERKKSRGMYNL